MDLPKVFVDTEPEQAIVVTLETYPSHGRLFASTIGRAIRGIDRVAYVLVNPPGHGWTVYPEPGTTKSGMKPALLEDLQTIVGIEVVGWIAAKERKKNRVNLPAS